MEIAEICASSGKSCGSIFLDLRFQELVKALLVDHPVHLDPASLANFVHSFSETDKLAYRGVSDDGIDIVDQKVNIAHGTIRHDVSFYVLQCRGPP